MTTLHGLLASALSYLAEYPAFTSETSIQHLFVRQRVGWIKSRLARGKSVDDIASTLGVPTSIVQHELMLDRNIERR